MGRHVNGVSAVVGLAVLACFMFCWASSSAASIHINDGERKPWMDEMEANLQNDIYLNEIVNRLRALNDAELAGLAQYEIDNYFRKHVPFFHLYNHVPASSTGPQSVLAGKRGFDFGLGRGFSASQAAKHKMGLAAAEFPSGPGRRRRSLEQALRH